MNMEIVLLIILVVLVVALFGFSFFKRKKFNNELASMRAELKIGDKVMTDAGVVGEVVDSYMEDEYKYFVLKTGKDKNVGYINVHANAIYYVYNKEEPKKVVVKVDEPKEEQAASTSEPSTEQSKEEATTPKSTTSKAKKSKK